MVMAELFLIDATAFCYRSFYALGDLKTSFGQPVSAIYGFVGMLNKILKEKKPDFLAACFDVSRDTFRQKKFAEYKINRPPMPDALSSQLPFIKEIIFAYGIAVVEKEGYEADDIISTIATKLGQRDILVTVVSHDKDMLQLVDSNITVFSPHKDEGVFYDRDKVIERFGVEPERITDIVALMGDSVDNIPGVTGIGEKTAAALIKDFKSLEGLLQDIDSIKQEKLKKAVKENIGRIKLNKELAELDRNVSIELDLDKFKIGRPDFNKLFKIFKQLEFKKFLKELPVVEENVSPAPRFNDKEIKNLINKGNELILFGEALNDMVFSAGDKTFMIDNPGINSRCLLADPQIKKTGHNLKKTIVALSKDSISLSGLYFDTMIAAYLVNPSKSGYDLADIGWDYLGGALGHVISNRKAVDLIRQLRPKLEKELRERQLSKLFWELEMPLVEVLADMELAGITLDLDVIKKLSCDIEKRLIGLIEEIYKLSGTQFNINSPKQLRQILFEKLKLPVVKRSKTGPSTDEEVLRNLAGKHMLPALLLEYRHLMKLKNTYVDTLPELIDKKTQRVHTSFNQAGTETGRLSSSNPNLQNIPVKTDVGRNLRKAIVARASDNYLLSCDYSQIELRILAHLSADEGLTLAFKEGKDIHKATASLIYGVKEKDVSDAMRETAKRINFGIVYGLSSYGLSRDLDIAVDEAQSFIDAYFARYPGVKDYIQGQIEKAQKDGFVTTLLGRRRYIPEINNKNQGIRQFAQRQAVNTPIQGSASDLIKSAMIQIYRLIIERKLQAKLILQVHDELVFDVSEKELKFLAEAVRDRMENVMELNVPVRVDIKKGKNWLEMELA